MRKLLLIFFVWAFATVAKAQCVLDASQKASASKLKAVQNYSGRLPSGAITTINNVLSYLNKQYGKNVKHTYITDTNAYYMPGTDSIFLGIPLFKMLWESGGASSIAFVICHEFGHYGQYLFPNNNRVVDGTHRVSELQADFVGSYLMYNIFTQKVIPYSEEDYDKTIKNIFNLGDMSFNDADHHGSYIERLLTVQLVEGTQLGQDFSMNLSKIYELANKIYTSSGINICGNLPGPGEITGAGFLYNTIVDTYYVIAIDFKIYPVYKKQSGQLIPIKNCTAIGQIDVKKNQHLDIKKQTLGFYINIYNTTFDNRLYISDKAVYDYEDKSRIVHHYTWRTDSPFTPLNK